MATAIVIRREAVLDAVEEFDRVGRDVFLEAYGFGAARKYFLRFNGCLYDSKAIVGTAYCYEHPESGPMAPSDFSGGEDHACARCEGLASRSNSLTTAWRR